MFFRSLQRTPAFQQSADGLYECRAGRAKLADTMLRHLLKDFLAAWKQCDKHASAILAAAIALYVAMGLQPVNELDDAVVLQGQTFG